MTAVRGVRAPPDGAPAGRGVPRWTEPTAVVAALALYVWGAWTLISVGGPLGHDEAWYAAMGDALAHRRGDVGLASHRPAFFGWLSAPVQLVDQSAAALRLIALPSGVAVLLVGWWFARRLGRLHGVVALAGLATAPSLYRGGSLYLTDLSAAALLLLAVALLWYGFEERAAPGWAPAAAAACMAVAFHLRFGSVLPIGLVLVIAGLVWRRRLRAHARELAAGATVGVILLLPHLIAATVTLGAPWRRVLQTSESVVGDLAERGLFTYVEMFPLRWPGLLPGGLALLAVGGLALAALGPRGGLDARLRRLVLLLAAPGLLHFLLIGWTAHPEVRFLYPALAFTVTAGAAVAAHAVVLASSVRAGRGARALLAAGVALVLAVGVVDGARGYSNELDERRRTAELNLPMLRIAREIARAEDPPRCTVLTAYNPQIQWYSGCRSVKLPADPERARERVVEAETDVLVVLFNGGKLQPTGAELDAYLERVGAEQRGAIVHTGTASALEPVTIYRVPQQPAGDG